ncbi:hypothetical protein FQN57_005210 [Myotisia sp. PD_48]|nr:hypothetical protein FQN57_005210 [Myotisia sp. PD_48]
MSRRLDGTDTISSVDETKADPEDGLTIDQNRLSKLDTTISTASQQYQSVISRLRSRTSGQNASFSHPLEHAKTSPDVLVTFDGPDDPYMPQNWTFRKKCITTFLYGFTTMGSTWASAAYSPGIHQIAREFDVSEQISTLGMSLLLFGFAVGPLLWAPLSELYGRKPAVLFPYFIAAIFAFATATAENIQTVMIARFFCGFFASAPITNTGGVLGDIWSPEERGAAIVGYAFAVTGGPTLGPIVGGAIIHTQLSWRWIEYISGIMMLFFVALDAIFIDESYPPILLVYKAQKLRHQSGNWALHAAHEEWDVGFREMANKYLIVPFQLLATPICFLVALYASFCYGILYMNLTSFPIQFQEERGWDILVGQTPFLALLVGVLLGGVANLSNQKFYIQQYKKNNNRPLPEARLRPMMYGSVVFAAGLFIIGWTSDHRITWVAPVLGAVTMGFGFFTVFQGAINYLIDTFPTVSASAIGANTFLRSVFGGGFPLFARPMFNKLGIAWASSLLGFFAVALIPIPFLFYTFGRRIRAKGKWSRPSL